LHELYALKLSTVLVLAVVITTGVAASFAIWTLRLSPELRQPTLGFYSQDNSHITDTVGDARPVPQRNTSGIAPGVQDYHDIVGVSVKGLNGPSFLLTTYLAGNPNLNEKYETMYAWHIITKSSPTGQDQVYIVAFANFPTGFINATEPGWYYAVFDGTAGSLILPFTRIWDMPNDRIEYPVEASYIGGATEFRYWVSSYVRVNNTSFGSIPDYLMDDAP
jgi:hypothetical protein